MVRLVHLGKPNAAGISPFLNINPNGGSSLFMPDTAKYVTEINNFLPEGKDLTLTHSEWVRERVVYDLIEDNYVNITFLSEHGGFKNSFGYFIYDTQNPPTSWNDLGDVMVIFPNVSSYNTGGIMVPGDSVALPSEWSVTTDANDSTFHI